MVKSSNFGILSILLTLVSASTSVAMLRAVGRLMVAPGAKAAAGAARRKAVENFMVTVFIFCLIEKAMQIL